MAASRPSAPSSACDAARCTPSSLSFHLSANRCGPTNPQVPVCVDVNHDLVSSSIPDSVEVSTPGVVVEHIGLGEFRISSSAVLPAYLQVIVVNSAGQPIQFVSIASSCRPPLVIGAHFGALALTNFACRSQKSAAGFAKSSEYDHSEDHGPVLHFTDAFSNRAIHLLSAAQSALLNEFRNVSLLLALFDASSRLTGPNSVYVNDLLKCLVVPTPTPTPRELID